MSVRERGDRRGKGGGYWGLVEQRGPWKETPKDDANLAKAGPVVGGGLGAGGTKHAGDGHWAALINPYQQNGRRPSPYPSKYVQRRVVSKKPLGIRANKGVLGKRGGGDFLKEVEQPEQPHLYPSQGDHDSDVASDDTLEYLPVRDQYGNILKGEDSGDLLADGEEAFKFDLLDAKNGGWDLGSLAQHAVSGALDLASGNLVGVGAHIGGAIGDLVIKPIAEGLAGKSLHVDTNTIANYVSLGGIAVNAISGDPFGNLFGESPIHDAMNKTKKMKKPTGYQQANLNESVHKANEELKRVYRRDEARVGELGAKMRGYDLQMEDVFPQRVKTPFHTFNDPKAPWNV